MAQEIINDGDIGAVVRAKINGNFDETFTAIDELNGGLQAQILARGLGC